MDRSLEILLSLFIIADTKTISTPTRFRISAQVTQAFVQPIQIQGPIDPSYRNGVMRLGLGYDVGLQDSRDDGRYGRGLSEISTRARTDGKRKFGCPVCRRTAFNNVSRGRLGPCIRKGGLEQGRACCVGHKADI
ncbi:MAG: hypothetical protein WC840_04790 [Candidatus Peribacteraceae bacterium]